MEEKQKVERKTHSQIQCLSGGWNQQKEHKVRVYDLMHLNTVHLFYLLFLKTPLLLHYPHVPYTRKQTAKDGKK